MQSDIESFAAELIDRFGPIPDEVENLLKLITIKQLCKAANIAQVEAGPKGVLIAFHNNQPKDPAAMMGYVQDKAGTVKLRPDQKLFFPRGWTSADQRMTGTNMILRELSQL